MRIDGKLIGRQYLPLTEVDDVNWEGQPDASIYTGPVNRIWDFQIRNLWHRHSTIFLIQFFLSCFGLPL